MKYLIGAIVFLLVVLAYVFQLKKEAQNLNEQNLLASIDTIKSYKDKYNQSVSEKRSYIIESEKKLKQLLHSNDSLKSALKKIKIKSLVKLKNKYERDTIFIPYKEEIPYKFNVPWNYKDKWLKTSGISTNEGVSLNSYVIENDISLAIGYTADAWYKPYYAKVRVLNSNPNVETTKINSYIVKNKKKFFEKSWFLIGVGFMGGFLLSK